MTVIKWTAEGLGYHGFDSVPFGYVQSLHLLLAPLFRTAQSVQDQAAATITSGQLGNVLPYAFSRCWTNELILKLLGEHA